MRQTENNWKFFACAILIAFWNTATGSGERYLSQGRDFRQEMAYDSAVKYLILAADAAEEGNNRYMEVESLSLLAATYSNLEEREKADSVVSRLLWLAEENGSALSADRMWAYRAAGKIAIQKQKYGESVAYFSCALDAADEALSSVEAERASILEEQSVAFIYLAKFQEGEDALKEALRFFRTDSTRFRYQISDTYNHLGFLAQMTGKYQQAEAAYLVNLEILEKLFYPGHLRLANTHASLGNNYRILGNYEQAYFHMEKALEIVEKQERPLNRFRGGLLLNLATVVAIRENLDKAIEDAREAIKLFNQMEEPPLNYLAAGYLILGNFLHEKGDYDQALQEYLYSLDTYRLFVNPNHPSLASCYNNIGNVYVNMGDHERALGFFSQAYQIWIESYGPEHPRVAKYFHNCAVSQHEQGKLTEAKASYLKALQIKEKIWGPQHQELAVTISGLGDIEVSLGNLESGRKYYRSGISLESETFGPASDQTVVLLDKIGRSFLIEKNFQEAYATLESALSLLSGRADRAYPKKSFLLVHLAEACIGLGRYAEAIRYFDLALAIYFPEKVHPETENLPAVGEISDKPGLLNSLKEYGEGLRKICMDDSSQIEENGLVRAFGFQLWSAALIDSFRMDISSDPSEILLIRKSFPLYESGIETALALWKADGSEDWLWKAFRLSEKSKSVLLHEGLRKSSAIHYAGVPDSLLEKEHTLSVERTYWKRMQDEKRRKGAEQDSLALKELDERVFFLNEEYRDFIQTLETEYPAYHKLKYDLSVASPEALKKFAAGAGTEILEYFWGDSSVFCFRITGDGLELFRVGSPDSLSEQIKLLVGEIQDGNRSGMAAFDPAAAEKFDRNAHEIFLRLFPEGIRSETQASILVVPDGQLGLLPFELLVDRPHSVKEKASFRSLSYLFKEHDIHYAFSATLILEAQSPKRGRKNIGGFAPSYPVTGHAPPEQGVQIRDGMKGAKAYWGPLENNIPETEEIVKIGGGDAFVGERATEATFKKVAKDYRVLHLSMHAYADDSLPLYSVLAFQPTDDSLGEDGFLFGFEIFEMSLNADLAVLSACNTGSGKFARGEGIMNLARTFRYTGCTNIVLALWEADDLASRHLMADFFRHLKSGKGKAGALREAKLALLETRYAHPHFWAPFILVGDESAVFPKERPFRKAPWIGFVFLLSVGAFWFYRRKAGKN
jgi:CHAT domain-containing protein/Tfp pilus assembly protein PilF